jgi:hypothetical protein
MSKVAGSSKKGSYQKFN